MYNIAYKIYDIQFIICDTRLLSIRKLAPLPTCCIHHKLSWPRKMRVVWTTWILGYVHWPHSGSDHTGHCHHLSTIKPSKYTMWFQLWIVNVNYIGTTLHLYYVYAHVSSPNVILNPPQCEAAGMMESGGSSFYASCGGGFLQPITVRSL